MGDVYLGAGRVAKSPRKQQGFQLFTDRWISGLFVGRSELKQCNIARRARLGASPVYS